MTNINLSLIRDIDPSLRPEFYYIIYPDKDLLYYRLRKNLSDTLGFRLRVSLEINLKAELWRKK